MKFRVRAGEVRNSEVLDSSSCVDDRDVFGYRKGSNCSKWQKKLILASCCSMCEVRQALMAWWPHPCIQQFLKQGFRLDRKLDLSESCGPGKELLRYPVTFPGLHVYPSLPPSARVLHPTPTEPHCSPYCPKSSSISYLFKSEPHSCLTL